MPVIPMNIGIIRHLIARMLPLTRCTAQGAAILRTSHF